MAGAALRGDLLDALRRLTFPAAVLDVEGRVVWQNDASREISGPRIGRPFGDIIEPDDRQRVLERLHRTRNRRESSEFAFRIRGVDGRVLNADVSIAPLLEGEQVVGVFGVGKPSSPVDSLQPHAAVDLTPRQRQVLAALARGRSTEEIAAELGISLETVRNHIRGVLRGLGVHSRIAAIVRAHELGLI